MKQVSQKPDSDLLTRETSPVSIVLISATLFALAIAAAALVLFLGHESVSHSLSALMDVAPSAGSAARASRPISRRPEVSPAARGRSAIIVQVESRPLTTNFSDGAQYHSLGAAINYQYARAHGYELLPSYPPNISYAADIEPADWATAQHPRLTPACLHPSLRHARAPPWCKLLGWWWGVTQSPRHTWVVGLDSDAFISNHSLPVHLIATEFLRGRPRWGADPAESHLIAFNEPVCHREEMRDVTRLDSCCLSRYANTGAVLARAGATGEMLFRRWWDVDDTSQALMHPFEQDDFGALWREGYGNFSSTVCLSGGGHFSPDAPNQWIRHFPGSYVMRERHEFMRAAAKAVGINASTFPGIIADMRASGAVRPLDQVAIAMDMAARTAAEAVSGKGVFLGGCLGNHQCGDELHGDPNFGVTPGMSRRTPPFVLSEFLKVAKP